MSSEPRLLVSTIHGHSERENCLRPLLYQPSLLHWRLRRWPPRGGQASIYNMTDQDGGMMVLLMQGEIDVRLNSFKGCFHQVSSILLSSSPSYPPLSLSSSSLLQLSSSPLFSWSSPRHCKDAAAPEYNTGGKMRWDEMRWDEMRWDEMRWDI